MRKAKFYALVTGASSGIGYEFARILALEGYNLVIVARSKDKLIALKKELIKHSVDVHVLVEDLAKSEAAREIYKELQKKKIKVNVLINNAGFADHKKFIDADSEKLKEMVQVNVATLTELTQLFARDMVKQGGGKMLNVASMAAFQPGPWMAVYYATKAYVLSFSEAIAEELKGTGVTVTTLCPGATASGFQERANVEGLRMLKVLRPVPAIEAALFGYRAMQKGKTVAVHGLGNYIVVNAVRFIPRSIVTRVVKRIQQ